MVGFTRGEIGPIYYAYSRFQTHTYMRKQLECCAVSEMVVWIIIKFPHVHIPPFSVYRTSKPSGAETPVGTMKHSALNT